MKHLKYIFQANLFLLFIVAIIGILGVQKAQAQCTVDYGACTSRGGCSNGCPVGTSPDGCNACCDVNCTSYPGEYGYQYQGEYGGQYGYEGEYGYQGEYGYEYQYQGEYAYQYEYEYEGEPDFVVYELSARDVDGNAPTYFDAGQNIYVRLGMRNSGSASPCCTSRTAIYKNKSSTVADGTASDIPMYVDVSTSFSPGSSQVYESFPNGNRRTQYAGTYSFQQTQAGTYYLRAFADYNNRVNETVGGSANQLRATYEVRSDLYGWVCYSENEDATCDTGEPKVSGVRIELWRDDGNSYGTYIGSDTTVDAANDRDYEFADRRAADYQVRMVSTSWLPISSANRNATIGPDTRIRFAVKPAYTISGTVFIDTDRDGVQDPDETTPYQGATITLSGTSSGTDTTDANGNFSFTGKPRGTYTVTITEPTGYRAYPATTRSITIPLNSATRTWTANFGLNQVYNITGRVYVDADKNGSYSSTSDTPLQNQTVSVTGPRTSSTTTLSTGMYSLTKLEPGTYSLTTTSGDYNSLTTLPMTVTITNANVTGQDIRMFGKYSISGNVFVDSDDNFSKGASETNYAADPGITVSSPNGAPTPIVTNNANGSYTITGLISGTYTVRYPNLPAGFVMNNPRNGPPAAFSAPIGSGCAAASPTPGGSCNAGSLENLDFAIKGGQPWYQAYGLDVRFDSGLNNPVPPSPDAACVGSYAMLPSSASQPGISFTGDNAARFWQGQSAADPYNWVIGGTNYGETFAPTNGSIKTSYNYMRSVVTQSNITTTDLATVCTLSNCTLPGSLANGVYTASGNVTLNSFTAAANRDIVILINGNLTINGTLDVPTSSTVFYSAAGNIYVAASVGSTAACPAPANGNIEGYFSADDSFIVQTNASCSSATPVPDKQLNIQGSLVVNASGNGTGSFTNQRDLCTDNITFPSVTLKERPDFVLNAPNVMKVPNYIWQEIAP